MPDLTFADFVKLYNLPPNVTVRHFKELAGIGHTRTGQNPAPEKRSLDERPG